MNIRDIKQELLARQRLALSTKESAQHAIDQLEQMKADGAEEVAGLVPFHISGLGHQLGVRSGYYEGQAQALMEALDLIDELPVQPAFTRPLNKAIEAAEARFRESEQAASDATDQDYIRFEAYWLGITMAAEIIERATGRELFGGYYDSGEPGSTDQFFGQES